MIGTVRGLINCDPESNNSKAKWRIINRNPSLWSIWPVNLSFSPGEWKSNTISRAGIKLVHQNKYLHRFILFKMRREFRQNLSCFSALHQSGNRFEEGEIEIIEL